MKYKKYSFSACILAVLMIFSTAALATQNYFQGKKMTIIVPSGVGGGYDTWARLAAPFFKKYLGLASVQVENRTGGGGLIGTNALYEAKPDGLIIGDTNAAGDYFAQISGDSGVKFDVRKFSWLGHPDGDPHVIAVRKNGPYKSFKDLINSKSTIKAFATGKGSADYNADIVIYKTFGIPFKMIAAFKGSHQEKATFLAGEGDTIPCSASCIARMGSDLKEVVVVDKQPFDQLPDVPTVIQAAKEAGLPSQKVQVLNHLAGMMSLGHAFVAPPNMPAERLALLRKTFQKIVHNPDFRKKAKKARLYLGYESGGKMTKSIQEAYAKRGTFKHLLASE